MNIKGGFSDKSSDDGQLARIREMLLLI